MYNFTYYRKTNRWVNAGLVAGLIATVTYVLVRYPGVRRPASVVTALLGIIFIWSSISGGYDVGWTVFYAIFFPALVVVLWVWGTRGTRARELRLTPGGMEKLLAGMPAHNLSHKVTGPSAGAPAGRPGYWPARQPVEYSIVQAHVDPSTFRRDGNRAVAQATVTFVGGQSRCIVAETDGFEVRWAYNGSSQAR
jgi:hypothetical protein